MYNVLEKAGIDPLDVDYLGAHGTGTKAGDPLQLNAIGGAGLNPNIPFQQLNVQIPLHDENWFSERKIHTAAVNAFGYGGTNGHAILSKFESVEKVKQSFCQKNPTSYLYTFQFSANSVFSLQQNMRKNAVTKRFHLKNYPTI